MKYEFMDKKSRVLGIYIEREEDLWLLYILIKKGDIVTMKTTRDVSKSENGEYRRIPMTLSIRVISMEFQPFTNRLRIRGLIVEGPEEYGLRGHYHTFSVEPGSYIELYREDGWTSRDIKRLEKYASSTPRLLAISIDDDELAIAEYSVIGLRTLYTTDLPIMRKGYETTRDERVDRLREELINIESLLNKGSYKSVLLIGPPLWIEQVKEDLSKMLSKKEIQLFVQPNPYGGLKGLRDIETSGLLHKLLGNSIIKIANDTFEELLRALSNNERIVAIGLDEVKKASEAKAIKKLLIIDEYISTYDEKLRNTVEDILEKADLYGGEIIIVPSASIIAEKLRGLGGIVALLRFEIY